MDKAFKIAKQKTTFEFNVNNKHSLEHQYAKGFLEKHPEATPDQISDKIK